MQTAPAYRSIGRPWAAPDDTVLERAGAKVVIDQVSLGFLAGSEIDFVDDLIGASSGSTIPKRRPRAAAARAFRFDAARGMGLAGRVASTA